MPEHPSTVSRTWLPYVFTVLAMAVAVPPAAAQAPEVEQEHLPRRAKPPAPGVRPSALPAYAERLGVPARTNADRTFDRIVDEFLLFDLRLDPVRATNLGVHDYDALVPATDSLGFAAATAELDSFRIRLANVEVDRLGRERRFDHAMLTSHVRGALFDRETIRTWKRDPRLYLSIASDGIDALLERDYAPLEERGWNVVARLTEIPRILENGRANLENPPRLYTEIAIEQAADLVRYLSNELPVKMAPTRDPVLREEFDHHLAAAAGTAASYYDWLRSDLLLRSNGELSLGANTYAQTLRFDAMVETPLDSLRRHAEAQLHATQRRMEEEANAIAVGLPVRDALARLAQEQPAAHDVVSATEAAVGTVRRFMAAHAIVGPLGREDLTVARMPVYLRGLSFAAMDAPGPLETRSTAAYFYVTPPDDAWPARRQAAHVGFFNMHQLAFVSIHEAVPGRYTQSLALRKCPSLVRALFPSGANSEGWPAYCEEMMLGQGYGADDPRDRLAQLQRALQRECECFVSLTLNTRGMTLEGATAFFEREAYRTRVDAELDARRCLADPGSPLAVLGRWQIFDLREEIERQRGAGFRLEEFHDRFLTYGGAPIGLIRDDW